MMEVFNTTFVLFFTIFFGLIMGYSKIFPKGSDKTFIHLVFYILLPLQLFLSCYRTDTSTLSFNYGLAYVGSMLVMATFTFFITIKLMKGTKVDGVLNSMSVTQVDGAYFAIPLFMLVFSSAAFAIPLMAIQNIVFFTVSVLMIELLQKNSLSGTSSVTFVIKRIIKVSFTNPIILSSVLGFIFGGLKVPINHNITHSFEFLGKASAPVALFSIGLSCSYGLRQFKVDYQMLAICVLTVLKLLVFPLVALLFGLALGLHGNLLLALILLCSTPTATHNYIIANQHDLPEQVNIQTFVVVFTTILSFLSVNMWMYFIK